MQPLGAEKSGRRFDLVLSDEFKSVEKCFEVNPYRWNSRLMEQHERDGLSHPPMFYPNNNWLENDKLVQQWTHDEITDIYSSGRIDTSKKVCIRDGR